MREIKFRVWDALNKRLIEDDCDFSINFQGDLFKDSGLTPLHLSIKNYPVTQYTDLKDKNGKDIYEGDIIRYRNEDDKSQYFDVEVIFKLGAFMIQDRPAYIWAGSPSDDIEVIGNIFENPELLQKPKES